MCAAQFSTAAWDSEMVDWIVRTTQSSPHKVGVALKHREVRLEMMGREVVYSINPKQLDRYRDRFSLAGAKDDYARVLAETVRLDRNHLRRLDAQMPEVVMLRDCSRLHGQLTVDNDAFGAITVPGDLQPEPLELWMLAPTPHKAKRLRLSSLNG